MRAAAAACVVALMALACSQQSAVDPDGGGFSVFPSEVELIAGDTLALSLLRSDRAGAVLPELPGAAWTSRDPAIVEVTGTGTVLALREGEVHIVARHGTHSDSATIRVSRRTPPSSPRLGRSARYPNEPMGNQLIAQTDMSYPFTWPESSPPGSAGTWWEWIGDPDSHNSALITEPGAPGGPHLIRTRFPRGLRPGVAPVNWGGWTAAGRAAREQFGRIYFSKRIRLVDPGDGEWESQRIGTKLGFFGVGRCSGSHAEIYLLLQGGLRSEFEVRVVQQGPISRRLGQDVTPGPVMEVGKWYQWEIEMLLNTVGTSDGELRWWIDGQLVMDHRDVMFRTRWDACGFLAYKWNPTWGGTGGEVRGRDDHLDISEVRISGLPLR